MPHQPGSFCVHFLHKDVRNHHHQSPEITLSTTLVSNTQTWPKVLQLSLWHFLQQKDPNWVHLSCLVDMCPQCLSVWSSSSVLPWFSCPLCFEAYGRGTLCSALNWKCFPDDVRLSVSARTSQKDAGSFFCIPLGGSIICVLLLMEHWLRRCPPGSLTLKVFFSPLPSVMTLWGDFLRVISYFPSSIQPLTLAPTDDSWLSITTMVVMEGMLHVSA